MTRIKTFFTGIIDVIAIGWIVFFIVIAAGSKYAKEMETQQQYERTCELVLISGGEEHKRTIYTNDDPETHDILHGHDGTINMLRSYHRIKCKGIKKPEE